MLICVHCSHWGELELNSLSCMWYRALEFPLSQKYRLMYKMLYWYYWAYMKTCIHVHIRPISSMPAWGGGFVSTFNMQMLQSRKNLYIALHMKKKYCCHPVPILACICTFVHVCYSQSLNWYIYTSIPKRMMCLTFPPQRLCSLASTSGITILNFVLGYTPAAWLMSSSGTVLPSPFGY